MEELAKAMFLAGWKIVGHHLESISFLYEGHRVEIEIGYTKRFAYLYLRNTWGDGPSTVLSTIELPYDHVLARS